MSDKEAGIIIECENAAFAYDGITVVKGLDFTVKEGDFLCIIGENGSGKSTLIKGLLGLKSPEEGKIGFAGGLRQNDIGYLPQQTVIQRDFPASVSEVVASGCQNKGGFRPFYTQEQKKLADKNMRRLGIEGLKKRCYRELSGGQQQRALLARALCASGMALLLDEPTAGLDPIVTHELYSLIERLNREDGLAIIMVSHDIDYVCRAAGHVLYIKESQRFFGTRAEFLKSGCLKALKGGENI